MNGSILGMRRSGNEKNFDAILNRGHVQSRLGLDDDAIKDYTLAIELNARNFDAHYQRGMIYNIQGMYTEALLDLEKCAHIKPGAEIDYLTGTIEAKLGNDHKAIHFFTNALKYDDTDTKYY